MSTPQELPLIAPAEPATSCNFLNFLELAPAPTPGRPRPAVARVLTTAAANHIVFTFLPGQDLPDHQAAHPITVQTLSGRVEFDCGEQTYVLEPGMAVHLDAHVPHAVRVPETGTQSVMLLIMHTRH